MVPVGPNRALLHSTDHLFHSIRPSAHQNAILHVRLFRFDV